MNNDSTYVTVSLSDVRASYNKMVEKKILEQYAEQLEKQLADAYARIEAIDSLFNDYKQSQKELSDIKDEKFKTLQQSVKVKKFQFLLGAGGTTNRDLNLIQLTVNSGFMINEKRIFIVKVGMDNRQSFLFGGDFLTTF